MEPIICPGCGVRLLAHTNSLDQECNASAACRELCYQLSFYTLSLRDDYFIHQLVVDTYTAQHVGKQIKPIAITFGLVGLYLVNERNFTGKQVQYVHMALAKANTTKVWPQFSLPYQKVTMTIKDVLASQDAEKQELIKKWNQAVWGMWKFEEVKITALLEKYRVL